MNDYTKEELKTISIWGTCSTCGAPRQPLTLEISHFSGKTETFTSLVCTNNPDHPQ